MTPFVVRIMGVAIIAALLVPGGAAFAQKSKLGKPDTGAGTTTAARKYLEGDWTLQSFEVFPPGKEGMRLDGSGVLAYDKFGNLRMELRPTPPSLDVLRQAGVEIPDSGIVSTQGRVTVDLQNHTLSYVLEGKEPGTGPLALNRKRYWQVQGDLLTLTTKDDAGKPVSVGIWKKRA